MSGARPHKHKSNESGSRRVVGTMDPITFNLSERSALTMMRVVLHDPTFTSLALNRDLRLHAESSYWSNDRTDLAMLGRHLERSKTIRTLYLERVQELVHSAEFFDGIRRNTSIVSIILNHCTLAHVGDRLTLAHASRDYEFLASKQSLRNILMTDCIVDKALMHSISKCTSVRHLKFESCNLDLETLEALTNGIQSLPHLTLLELPMNNFGRLGPPGCRALAKVLKDHNSNLVTLDLGYSNINNDMASMLARSLRSNKKLRQLKLYGRRDITDSGWVAFSRVLCNESSINATYHSNHTLENLALLDIPNDLSELLELNASSNKKRVACTKIINYHEIDIEPFLDLELKFLPILIRWFDGIRHGYNGEEDVAAKKLAAIFQFARALPELFILSLLGLGHKRKASEISRC